MTPGTTIRIRVDCHVHPGAWPGRLAVVEERTGSGVWVRPVEWPANVPDELGGRMWLTDREYELVGEAVVERSA